MNKENLKEGIDALGVGLEMNKLRNLLVFTVSLTSALLAVQEESTVKFSALMVPTFALDVIVFTEAYQKGKIEINKRNNPS